MVRNLLASLIFLIAVGSLAEAQCTNASCPPCLKLPAPTGSGPAGDGSGRRTLFIYIDSSWNTPGTNTTNTTIYNAVNQAAQDWNLAQDSACNTKTAYYFQLDQSKGSSADIIVQQSSTATNCGELARTWTNNIPTKPWYLTLRPAVGALTPTQATTIVRHELGHAVMLDNANNCQTGLPMLMGIAASLVSCIPNRIVAISSAEVSQSNRNISNNFSCTDTAGTAGVQLNPACPTGPSCGSYRNLDYCTYPETGCPNGVGYAPGPQGQDCCNIRSPIVIDVLGDGFNLTDAEHGVALISSGKNKRSKFHGLRPIQTTRGWFWIAMEIA